MHQDIDTANAGRPVIASVSAHTIGFAIKPRDGFEGWLHEFGNHLESRTYASGFRRETVKVPGCGLFIRADTGSGSEPQYKLSTESAGEPFLRYGDLFVPTGIYRLDVAIDYDADLSGCVMEARGVKMRKSHQSGRLESVYLGQRQSEKYFRIYDRAALKKRGDTGWRVELEWKPKKEHYELPENLFDGLSIRYFPPRGELSFRDDAMLFYAYHHPGCERGLTSRTRKNLQELKATHLETLNPSPSALYRAARSAIQRDVTRILSMPQASPPPQVAVA